jgi:hypothetical protein
MMRGSFESLRRLGRHDLIVLGIAATAGAVIFLIASELTYRIGFPLDDSWIHQTYARNLAFHGQWAFRPGLPSAGSTAPLWSGLLAIGYWLKLAPLVWALVLGGLVLWGIAILAEEGARRILPDYRPQLPWVGMFMALEWHMVWAAMSGMETLLHAFILTTVLVALATQSRRYLMLGLLTGLSVWVRPDGLTLIGPVGITILFVEPDLRSRMRALEQFLIGFGSLFLLYVLFNLLTGGRPMPNTFYAKQAEYALWQAKPFAEKAGQLAIQLLVGPSLVLLPGVLSRIVLVARKRDWGNLAGMAWFTGYVWLYISRLPPYQHGRYLMPAMPIFFLWGLLGLLEFARSNTIGRFHWFSRTVWVSSLVMITLLFVGLGARSYGEDVAVIESEMVATAQWASKNLPANAVIAAHDIGALGFFDNHKLIDLAGLISPEAVPFMRDETRLKIYLDQSGANYLIAFPEFYPELTLERDIIYVTMGQFSTRFGHQNMVIYRWK